ncbi:hypothetical protein DBV14_30710 [Variovorax sp. KBW07]|uniref:hypothetical protein n=1 Tax=Variovorax sp. KBW07 TaxID=2153358 RepID=UPI000F55A201|nr:hypothetical protein [Variovorax sp. KBW07]RQO39711.1 hypothetical protein DBV14_30710 [Variovorax sp. KBW07]
MFCSFRIRSLSAVIALLATAGTAQADYLWLSRDGAAATATARVGELEKTPQPVASVSAPRAFLADGKDLPLTVETDRVLIPVAAAGTDLRAVASRVTGESTLVQYQARWGRTETKAVNDLELVPTEPNGNTFKLVWKGNTVAASQVNVDTAEGWRRVLKPAKDGTVTLATPFPGLYVLEVSARVNGAVTVGGKKYEEVRHTATLSFEVPR